MTTCPSCHDLNSRPRLRYEPKIGDPCTCDEANLPMYEVERVSTAERWVVADERGMLALFREGALGLNDRFRVADRPFAPVASNPLLRASCAMARAHVGAVPTQVQAAPSTESRESSLRRDGEQAPPTQHSLPSEDRALGEAPTLFFSRKAQLAKIARAEADGQVARACRLPELGELIAGRFLVGHRIAKGGMGVVYEAYDRRDGIQRVMKCMLPDLTSDSLTAISRFWRECIALDSVKHENVVSVVDYGEDRGVHYIVQERLPGQTLRELWEEKCIDQPSSLRVICDAMRGAIALNEAGIVHRDIKPDNILVCPAPDGRPGRGVVIDLGLAKVCSYKVLKLTKRHECFGTPGYAAPEQLESDPDLDSRADVFAVGAMLYELLGGRVPYDGRNPVEVRAQMEAPVPHLVVLVPDVPRELADAVMDAIQVDVKLRPGTLTQLLKVVERHLEHGTSPATHAALGHVRGNGLGYDPDWLGLSYVLHRWLQVIAVRTASLSGYLRAASRVLCMRIWTRLRHAFRRDADA